MTQDPYNVEIRYNEPEYLYRKEIGVNQSSLKQILRSPAHYKAALDFKMFPSPVMEIGTAVHCRVLDGEQAFEGSYILKPDTINLTTKEGKEWKTRIGKRKILTDGGKDNAWTSVEGMTNSLRQLPCFQNIDDEYIKYNEVSIYWDWEGVRCKARLDRVLKEEGRVIDLKTTDTTDPDLFVKKALNLGYDFQAGFYTKAAEVAFNKLFTFEFIAVERRAPYQINTFIVSEEMKRESIAKCIAALRLVKTCEANQEWPSLPPKLYELNYPSWYVPFDASKSIEEDEAFLF